MFRWTLLIVVCVLFAACDEEEPPGGNYRLQRTPPPPAAAPPPPAALNDEESLKCDLREEISRVQELHHELDAVLVEQRQLVEQLAEKQGRKLPEAFYTNTDQLAAKVAAQEQETCLQ